MRGRGADVDGDRPVRRNRGARLLGFEQLATLVSAFLALAGQIVLGIILVAVGPYLAGPAARSISASKSQHTSLLATLTRGAIIVFAGSMALRATGLAREIVDLAFDLTFGALAVAAALAFGLGSRDTAGRFVEDLGEAVPASAEPR